MIKDCGCNWVILGHSERRYLFLKIELPICYCSTIIFRHVFGETDELIGGKVGFALESGLHILPCIGEKLEEREAGKTEEVCFAQLQAIADKVSDWSRVVLAYEPVWAIGTGAVATAQQIVSVHARIRQQLVEHLGPSGSGVPILYGGSVKPENAAEILALDNVNGALVGGASLKAEGFYEIVAAGVQQPAQKAS